MFKVHTWFYSTSAAEKSNFLEKGVVFLLILKGTDYTVENEEGLEFSAIVKYFGWLTWLEAHNCAYLPHSSAPFRKAPMAPR